MKRLFLIPLCFPHDLCLSFCPSSLLTALQFRIASSVLSPRCSNSAYEGDVPAGERSEFQKDKREICSPFLAKEIVTFAQLGVVMDGLYREYRLDVREIFCDWVRQSDLAQGRCQLLCTEQ